MTELTLSGAQVLGPDGVSDQPLSFAEGMITEAPNGRRISLPNCLILPGIVDLHGDGFERHVAPRRGAMLIPDAGIVAVEAEMAANGITTGVLAQFFSWEGGMRGPEFAEKVLAALARVAPTVATDLRAQLRLETHIVDQFEAALSLIDRYKIGYLVFNDHLQHARLAEGRRPKQLTGQALKSGRSPEAHFEMLIALHQNGPRVPAALDALSAELRQRGVLLGSHDDQTEADRTAWGARGVNIAEFPETRVAAEAALAQNTPVILGAPNVVRGNSHKGNVSARALVEEGLCQVLASDYHYPALMQAVWTLVDQGLPLEQVWPLVSSNPAQVLGLQDRGALTAGRRADFLVVEHETRRVGATFAGGRLTYASGRIGAAFFG